MKSLLPLLLLPFLAFGQLDCCQKKEEVAALLQGDWILKDQSSTKRLRFEFRNDSAAGRFIILDYNHEGKLVRVDNNPDELVIKIIGGQGHFEIEFDFGPIQTYSQIQYLDSIRLSTNRRFDEKIIREYVRVE